MGRISSGRDRWLSKASVFGGKVGARQQEPSDWSAGVPGSRSSLIGRRGNSGQTWASLRSLILPPTVLYVGASTKSVLSALRYNRECWLSRRNMPGCTLAGPKCSYLWIVEYRFWQFRDAFFCLGKVLCNILHWNKLSISLKINFEWNCFKMITLSAKQVVFPSRAIW
jgi:hypothetical protein